jgi:hypothetical protein
MIATATTALRDLHIGYPQREIAAFGGGTGLDVLLREMVAELRGRGIDDEGGLTCAVTEDIPVADIGEDGGHDVHLLGMATVALRDLYMGYPPDQIVSLSGESGLPLLVRELVADLRGRGIDDDGGWNCTETEGIPVGGGPAAP